MKGVVLKVQYRPEPFYCQVGCVNSLWVDGQAANITFGLAVGKKD
jgi:hypothetical protein